MKEGAVADWTAHHTPKTIRYCPLCGKQTTHEFKEGGGLVATICIPCVERALSYELDRE
jgi:hypothetical protein